MSTSAHSQTAGKAQAGLAIAALGVVFGDIGTSPLYALRDSIAPVPALERTASVLGVLSLIFWSLMLVVSWKYLTFITRADNRGEGGIFALFARGRIQSAGKKSAIGGGALLILFGACMLCGEGVITPAVSVLSAAEGLTAVAPRAKEYVVVITCVILAVVFLLQDRGSQSIGKVYGPVMVVWFATLGALGAWHTWQNPVVLSALNPYHAFALFGAHTPHEVTWILGGVVLAITGVEAIFADMGHFGRRAIAIAWYGCALPGLVLNYFGQGAHLLAHPAAADNPFIALAPEGPVRVFVLILSILAAVIASQAMISGTFSLIRSSVQLGFFPRLRVLHTNAAQRGQIYIPFINALLALGAITIVLGFQESTKLTAAYGIAVTSAMTVTTFAFYFVVRRAWHWPRWKAVLLCGAFGIVDATFLYANFHKILDGGWLPLAIGAGVLVVMHTWKSGKTEIFRRVYANEITEQELRDIAASKHITRVRGTGVFMAGNPRGTPLVLLHHVKANKVLHETVVLLSIMTEELPHVPESERLTVREIGEGVWRGIARYGYMESPDVSALIEQIRAAGVPLKPAEATYYFNREMIITGGEARMPAWQKRFYAFLSRNAQQARDYYQLPPMQIIEVGLPIQL